MDADDDLSTWGVRLDEPAAPPASPPPAPVADPEPPRLTLVSREVPTGEFRPRLRLGGEPE